MGGYVNKGKWKDEVCLLCKAAGIKAIDTKRTEKPSLGEPTTDHLAINQENACYRRYEHGIIFWNPVVGTHEVHGDIFKKFIKFGLGELGFPLSDELDASGGGKFNHFQHGSIYWHPDTGAHEIHGEIRKKWASLGWEKSFLGYPVSDELDASGGGKFNHFQHGSIYWHPHTGAHEIHGKIKEKWSSLGWEKSFLGYPITDELDAFGGGKFNHFQHGSIYWHPHTEAHEIHGEIKEKWSSLGWEKSFLGYPTSDESKTSGDEKGRYSLFQYGGIYSYPGIGTEATKSTMYGGILYDLRNVFQKKPAELEQYVSQDSKLQWFQKEILSTAFDELKSGISGEEAKDRYGAGGKWCSEFVSWVYLEAGMKDIYYPPYLFFLPLLNKSDLKHVSVAKDLVRFFARNGNRYKAAIRGEITPATAQPGDYLSVNNFGHSCIIVAVTYDRQYLWTIDGSADDKIQICRRDYFPSGKLDAKIDGIGKVDSGLFGNISSKIFY